MDIVVQERANVVGIFFPSHGLVRNVHIPAIIGRIHYSKDMMHELLRIVRLSGLRRLSPVRDKLAHLKIAGENYFRIHIILESQAAFW